jgi:hypothetical protein
MKTQDRYASARHDVDRSPTGLPAECAVRTVPGSQPGGRHITGNNDGPRTTMARGHYVGRDGAAVYPDTTEGRYTDVDTLTRNNPAGTARDDTENNDGPRTAIARGHYVGRDGAAVYPDTTEGRYTDVDTTLQNAP